MKNFIPLSLLTMALMAGVIEREVGLPVPRGYAFDLMLALFSVGIVARLIAIRAWATLPITYVMLFLVFVYVVIAGFLINGTTGDTAFAGIRNYFRYAPFFLIPFAYALDSNDLRFQTKWIFGLMLVQVPVAIWQRFLHPEYSTLGTGDEVRGTFTAGGSLAILGSAFALVAAAFYLNRHLAFRDLLVLGLAVLLPAMLSERKATPFMIAFAAIGLLYVNRQFVSRIQLASVAVSCIFLFGAFVAIYDRLYAQPQWGQGYIERMADGYLTDNYTFRGTQAREFEVQRQRDHGIVGVVEQLREPDEEHLPGRFDSFMMPFKALMPNEKLRLLLGLGAGNVDSDFGSGGDYRKIELELRGSRTSLSMLLWETGLFGALLFVSMIALFARDSYALALQGGYAASLGSAGVVTALSFAFAIVYANLHHTFEVQVLFMYVMGLVAAARTRNGWGLAGNVRHNTH